MSHICLIDAHPDPAPERLVHALSAAYQSGAEAAGHTVSRIDIAALDIAFLDSAEQFSRPPPDALAHERDKLASADHVALFFPLWLGSLPAKARAFLEQAARADFFIERSANDAGWPKRRMRGKSARIVVTMGMPGFAYKLFMDAGALKAIERGLFGLAGFRPVHHSVLGGVEVASPARRSAWLDSMERLGGRAE